MEWGGFAFLIRVGSGILTPGRPAAFGLQPGELDSSRIAEEVAELARTFAQRQAITRLLALPDRDVEAVISFLDQRSITRKRVR
mgnify:CR=1 FL=1